ncbi:MAG: 50S ribosomal protein L28 [Endomicrobium sp.]|jgi:large subunit ribosomal protein L28|nr:50S ribosomal protein L28 [Endomicrobium sp.]
MSYKCTICTKRPLHGNSVSHSNAATKRVFKPNLKRVRFMFHGKKVHKYVCTSCIKHGLLLSNK